MSRPELTSTPAMMRTLLLLGTALLLLAAIPGSSVATPRHFQLDRSLPAADSEAPDPTAVVLWFSQAPQDDATTIRVLDASGQPIPAADVVQDPVDPTVFLLPIPNGMAPGSYTVSWRSMAADGHVIREEFTFTAVAP